MNISIDGLRHNMARNFVELSEVLSDVLKDQEIENNLEIAERLDQVARDIRFLGWLSDSSNDSFNEIHEDIDKYFTGIIDD